METLELRVAARAELYEFSSENPSSSYTIKKAAEIKPVHCQSKAHFETSIGKVASSITGVQGSGSSLPVEEWLIVSGSLSYSV